jgi:hypothetical protein
MKVAISVPVAMLLPYEQRTIVLDNHDCVAALWSVGFLALERRHVSAARLQRYAFYLARLVGLAVVRSTRQVTGSRA